MFMVQTPIILCWRVSLKCQKHSPNHECFTAKIPMHSYAWGATIFVNPRTDFPTLRVFWFWGNFLFWRLNSFSDRSQHELRGTERKKAHMGIPLISKLESLHLYWKALRSYDNDTLARCEGSSRGSEKRSTNEPQEQVGSGVLPGSGTCINHKDCCFSVILATRLLILSIMHGRLKLTRKLLSVLLLLGFQGIQNEGLEEHKVKSNDWVCSFLPTLRNEYGHDHSMARHALKNSQNMLAKYALKIIKMYIKYHDYMHYFYGISSMKTTPRAWHTSPKHIKRKSNKPSYNSLFVRHSEINTNARAMGTITELRLALQSQV